METLLKQVKEYIEKTQQTIDAEWGKCRGIEELIKDGKMPEIYNKVLHELSYLNNWEM